ncbi:NCS1 family nucleobase:cation symporter-1 [Brevibacterium sanguinis]|uniref:NCS1 family nucleobase:cation symporter-1 n=2 Tax=Brevibacterium TaxID=1696 RepID=A0A366IHS3_9MICO|nr:MULTISPECIES: cytosine permease [Brevibacterium]RBP64904.1 NCS1 family nucleobase:cation symporter-1 [Brevibacterium sanguinis]RBP71167.1 NCS1 family nucleobase:cation symporter-1 [Brevibacterium celere]
MSDITDTNSKTFVRFEQQHVLPIPDNERTGTNWSLFAIWVSLNMMPLTVITGAVASGAYGLPILWSIVAILAGNVIGAFGSALHASQGPHLGVPQMLQARAQFGYLGASLFAIIAFIMFMGFFSSILIVAKDSLLVVFPDFDGTMAIVLFAVIGIGLCVFGYDLLQKTMTWLSIFIGLAVTVSMVLFALEPEVTSQRSEAAFTFEGFFAMLAIGIVWQLAYAPYVSDYSRYLPKSTGPKTAFWSTYLGLVLSSVFVMSLGVLLGAANPDNPLAALGEYLGPIGMIVLIVFAVSSALINGVELYSAVMNALTVMQSNFRSTITPAKRVWTTIISGGVATLIAVLGQGDFMTMFESFLTLLLYVLIPWSAINLADYFIVQKGHYDLDDLFAPDGGRYGKWNVVGLSSYGIGLLAQVPFMITPLFTGPLAKPLQFIDIAWLVGFVVTAVVYLVLVRARRKAPERVVELGGV